MPRGTGGNTRVYLKFEDTYGTSPGGDYVQIPFKGGFDLSSEQPVERGDVLGCDREPGTGERGLIVDRGTIPAPLDLRYLGYWLKSLLGAPATSGMGPYTHVFGGSGPPTTPPSLSVLVFHPDVPRYYRHNGVVVNTITLPFSVSDRITARIEVIAKGEETVTDTAAGTPTKHALTSFARLQGSIKKDGTALGRVVGGQVAISGNLEPATVIATDATIDGVDPGTMSANGTVTDRSSLCTLPPRASPAPRMCCTWWSCTPRTRSRRSRPSPSTTRPCLSMTAVTSRAGRFRITRACSSILGVPTRLQTPI